jgi:hypothetical protein
MRAPAWRRSTKPLPSILAAAPAAAAGPAGACAAWAVGAAPGAPGSPLRRARARALAPCCE